MEDYKKRMLDELYELRERIVNLSRFINENPEFSKLETIQKKLMEKQLEQMNGYAECLDARVKKVISWDEVDAYNKNLLYMSPENNLAGDESAIDDIAKIVRFVSKLSSTKDRQDALSRLDEAISSLMRDIGVWMVYLKKEDIKDGQGY